MFIHGEKVHPAEIDDLEPLERKHGLTPCR